ncbi:MAG: SdpI family protein [Erysipelotrichaceae bacterium]|nr:SdpI family protein [Erysipelotrichaceae bacterium]
MNKKLIIFTSLLILCPMIFGIAIYNRLPETLPTHWNFNGQIDGYSSRRFVVYIMPLMLLAIHLVCSLVISLDPKNQNVSRKIKNLVLWIVPVVSVFVSYAIYSNALGKTVDITTLPFMFIGILFMIIGNYMPKTRQNYTIGIKIPWTLDNEDNWNATHRFAGKLWFVGGFIFLIASILKIVNPLIEIIFVLVIAIIPTIYSYIYYRNNQ